MQTNRSSTANGQSMIAAWVQPETVLLDVAIRDREHALQVMAAAIGHSHGLDPAPIFRALTRREQAGSTALGDGFAIPHASIPGPARPLTVFMRTTTPVEFHAPDGKPVNVLLAILVPTGGSKQDHLDLLALVARLFSDRPFRVALDGICDEAGAAALFKSALDSLISSSI